MARSELARRVAVAAVGIPLAVLLVWLGGWPLGIVLALLAGLGAAEVCHLAGRQGVRAFVPASAALAAAFIVFAVEHERLVDAAPYFSVSTFGALVAFSIAGIWLRGAAGNPLFASATTAFGAIYVGGGLAYAVFLRHLALPVENGASWLGFSVLAYPLAVTWVGDAFAYFCGRAWGRRKLIPAVSPGKTWVGAFAGFFGAVLTGGLYGWLIFDAWLGLPIGWGAAALGAAWIAPAGQLGDLAESLLKRDADVKDSGTLFPGHGGVLDRFDALFVALPAAYLYLAVVLPLWIEGLPWR
jgi:phosphatidate cytidylyltransferase